MLSWGPLLKKLIQKLLGTWEISWGVLRIKNLWGLLLKRFQGVSSEIFLGLLLKNLFLGASSENKYFLGILLIIIGLLGKNFMEVLLMKISRGTSEKNSWGPSEKSFQGCYS